MLCVRRMLTYYPEPRCLHGHRDLFTLKCSRCYVLPYIFIVLGLFLLGFDRHLVQICDELLKDELLKGPVCDKVEVKMCRLECVDVILFLWCAQIAAEVSGDSELKHIVTCSSYHLV